jgi:hypothetical protein
LYKHTTFINLIILIRSWQLSLSKAPQEVSLLHGLLDVAQDKHDALASLAAAIVFLDDSDGLDDVDVKGESVVDDFYFRVVVEIVAHETSVDCIFLSEWH